MDYDELLPQQQSFEMMAAYLNGSTVNVTDNGKPQRYTGAYVTDRFLTILGTPPMLGRDFTPADNTPGAEKVAIIGYGIWQRDFGGSPQIVGKGVRINGKPATIVGVMPQGLRVSAERGALAAALQRVPAEGAQRSGEHQPVGDRPAQARRLARSGHRGVHRRSPDISPRPIPTRTSSSTPARSSR